VSRRSLPASPSRGRTPPASPGGRGQRNAPAQRGAQRGAQQRRHPERGSGPPERHSGGGPGSEVWIYGQHPATAALCNPMRKILRIVGTSDAIARLKDDADIPREILSRAHSMGRPDIDALVGPNAVHQGIAVLVRPLESHLADVLERAESAAQACIVVLDQVTDPHNVGAILRSAAAFGAIAVIAPDRGAPDESGAMAKSASGALEAVPYIKGVNLVRMLEELKEHRFWLVGLDAGGKAELAQVDLTGRIALVMGGEGEGLRRLVAETCDHMAHLPMTGATESLNVSNAAAVALYEWTRQARTKTG